MANEKYNWQYASVGGVVRVKLTSGEDIAHLGELDEKKWTVLSCPTSDLQFDQKTLSYIDTDKDGRIHTTEVVKAAQWLTSVLKDKDLILAGTDELALDQINTETAEGQALYNSAKQILANLGLEKESISLADAADSVAIFAKTIFNGDGIVTPASSEDESVKAVIADAIASVGAVADRSGADGIDAAKLDAFYAALADYAAWKDAGTADVFPYGENTAAADAAVDAIKAKVADYFMRCKLAGFNGALEATLDSTAGKVGAIADQDLAAAAAEIASCPLAHPTAEAVLSYKGINPAWQAAFDAVKSLVLDVDYKGAEGITEAEWNAVVAKLGAYKAWCGAKKGAEVEALGLDRVKALLAADQKAAVLELIAQDEAVKAESDSIDAVDKLMHLLKYFYRFLGNFVVFSGLYGRTEENRAIYEVGKLIIDERCCNFCMKVSGPGNHAEAAGLSGMFLIYCTVKSAVLGKSMDILAVMTDGGIKNLRPGKNAIFYDLQGNQWDAVVTKIVDNPISIKQAFWSPYVKLANYVTDKINKSAAEKESKSIANLQTSVGDAKPGDEKKASNPFDIAKFAGIFAAIGMALGFIGQALVSVAKGLTAHWYNTPLAIIAIIVLVSGPSMFIAWTKLRKRDLGPILNASGWAINSVILINILFGNTLTTTAKYPVIKGGDPFVKKETPAWVKWLRGILCAAVIAVAAILASDKWGKTHIILKEKAQVEAPAAEVPAAEAAPEAEVPADVVAE